MNYLFPLKAPWRLRRRRSLDVSGVADAVALVSCVIATVLILYMLMDF